MKQDDIRKEREASGGAGTAGMPGATPNPWAGGEIHPLLQVLRNLLQAVRRRETSETCLGVATS